MFQSSISQSKIFVRNSIQFIRYIPSNVQSSVRKKRVQSVCVVKFYLNQNNHRNDTSNNSYYTCARRTTIFEIQISKSIMNIRQKVDKHILDNSKQDRK